MTDDETKLILGSVEFFIDNVLHDMNKIKLTTKKNDLLAHIDAWKNELVTIKLFIKQ